MTEALEGSSSRGCRTPPLVYPFPLPPETQHLHHHLYHHHCLSSRCSAMGLAAAKRKLCLIVVMLAFACLMWNIHWTRNSESFRPVLLFKGSAESAGPSLKDSLAVHKENANSIKNRPVVARDSQNNVEKVGESGAGQGEAKKSSKNKASLEKETGQKKDSNGEKTGKIIESNLRKSGEGNMKDTKKKDTSHAKANTGGQEKKSGRGQEGVTEEEGEVFMGFEELEDGTDDPMLDLSRAVRQYRLADSQSPGPFTHLNLTAYVTWIWNEQRDCRWSVAVPRGLWLCPDYDSLRTAEKDYKRMTHMISCGGPLDPMYLKTPPRKEGLYPFEKFYLSQPPLADELLVANESLSKVTPLNGSTAFTIGDTIALRVDLKDGYGRHKVKGGDTVRAWMRDMDEYSSLAMRVHDFGNGTYLASARLMWAGRIKVKVAIAYPREYLRALVHLQLVMKSLKLSAGGFNNSEADEATACSHLPLIPGHEQSELCNLTEMNGSPWYCGRPMKSQLNCSDFVGSRNLPMPWKDHPFLPVTEAERTILDRSNREPRIRYILKALKIEVKPDAKSRKLLDSPVPCEKVTAAETWRRQQTPTGFFYDIVWHPTMCKPKPPTNECFKNLRLVVLGDSNCRSQHQYACDSTGSQHIQKALYKAWHAPLSCVNEKLNFSSLWYPHGNPFMSTNWWWAKLIPTPHAIDEIPSTGRTLVVLHHYLHLTTCHMTCMEAMHRANMEAVARLLKRNPEAKVIIRGPHVAYEGWANHYAAGDMFAQQIEELVADIYRPLQDRVFYLSGWDMTLSTENMEFHPDAQRMIADTIISIMCGR